MKGKEILIACPGCGWKYSYRARMQSCVRCHTRIPVQRCSICGAFVPPEERVNPTKAYCASCTKAFKDLRMAALTQRLEDKYEDWLRMIAAVPQPYQMLTDEQWQNACIHFGGCALCGADEISSRGFLIPFKQGGRYCDWNVVPMCERCAASTKTQPNVWIRMGYRQTPILQRIVDYLEPILKARINETGQT